jgi:hypothetical protein
MTSIFLSLSITKGTYIFLKFLNLLNRLQNLYAGSVTESLSKPNRCERSEKNAYFSTALNPKLILIGGLCYLNLEFVYFFEDYNFRLCIYIICEKLVCALIQIS